MGTKLVDIIMEKFKNNWKFWFSVVYFSVLIALVGAVAQKHNTPKVIPPPPPPVVATVDLAPINKRISDLEQELATQTVTIKNLKLENDSTHSLNQRLERRLQAHTEAFKRLCEYVVVITVDKKIIPRQCLPEYKWIKEEGS